MKKYVLLFLICASSFVQAQEFVKEHILNSKYYVGDIAELVTKQPDSLVEYYVSNRIKLKLEDEDLAYELKVIDDSLLLWRFKIPSKNYLVGEGKKLEFIDGVKGSARIEFDIFSKDLKPMGYFPKVLYKDVAKPQPISFEFNNASYVDKISFDTDDLKIEGTLGNEIESTNPKFIINETTNIITINVILGDNGLGDVSFHYRKIGNENKISKHSLDIDLIQKNWNNRFDITTSSDLYLDDFTEYKYLPEITFDFSKVAISDQSFTINSDSTKIKLRTAAGERTFSLDGGNKKINVEVFDLKEAGQHEISVKGINSDKFYTKLQILPEPKISSFLIANSASYEILKMQKETYSILIKGDDLHLMKDVKAAILNIDSGREFDLEKNESNISEDVIMCSLTFDELNDIPIGNYHLILKRKLHPANPTARIYKHDQIIKIKNPLTIIQPSQIETGLYMANYFNGDTLPKRYNAKLKGHLLEGDSPITFEIKPNITYSRNSDGSIRNWIPQYLKIEAIHIKSNGSEVRKTITEGGNDYVTVADRPVYIDINEELNIIDGLSVNEEVVIKLNHSQEVYGSNKLSPQRYYRYMRGVKGRDKIGITFSIPPYLSVVKRVRRKSVVVGENGETQVIFNGEKKIEFQSLTINAGLGIKFRDRSREDYAPSRWAVGAYIMGLDFGNKSSVQEQIEDVNSHDFIGRGSFNLMALGEFSFLNIDNPNTRIPVYAGLMYILDPLDTGSNFAFSFGIGIDIKLFGSN